MNYGRTNRWDATRVPLRASRPRNAAAVRLVLLATMVVLVSFAGTGTAQAQVEPEPRIHRGETVPGDELDDVGFMTRLEFDGGGFCGGALVAPTWVMTAAHCVDDRAPEEVRLRIGLTSLDVGDGVERTGREILLHPDWVKTPIGWLGTDAALVRVDSVDTVAPVALAANGDPDLWSDGDVARLIGWGQQADGTSPRALKQANVSVLSAVVAGAPSCDGVDVWVQLCAGDDSENTTGEACFGDSGSPLLVKNVAGEWVQIGIANAIADETCTSGSLHTRLDRLEQWWRPIVFPLRAISVESDVSCLTVDGLVAVSTANFNSSGVEIQVDIEQLSRSGRAEPGETFRAAVSGRRDGTYDVRVTARFDTGESEEWFRKLVVDCDEDVPGGIDISVTCLAGNGMIAVSMVNATLDPDLFVVNLPHRDWFFVVEPQHSKTVRYSGRPDGMYGVSAFSGAAGSVSELVEVDCDPDPTEPVEVQTSCLAGNGRVDVTLTNFGTEAVSHAVTIGGLAPRGRTVQPDSSTVVTATGRPDGPLTVEVTSNGTTFSQEVLIDC